MYRYLVLLATALLLVGCASSPKEVPIEKTFLKGAPYFVVGANVNLEVMRFGGDKTIKYPSKQDLSSRFKTVLTNKMRGNHMLAEDSEQAQANLDVTLNFTRTFVALTNRRMNPIMSFEFIAHKEGKVLAKFKSKTYTSSTRMYSKKSDADEFAVLDLFADKIVKQINDLEK